MNYVALKQLRIIAERKEIDTLAACTKALKNIDEDADRREYIDKNAEAWSAVRYKLWMLGHCKCWYSEVGLLADEGEIEHFRPKKQVWKTKPPHGGYWWRAFDWMNFRLVHPNVNKRKTDYSTKELAGKGCYFPVKPGTNHAVRESEEKQEVPLLLDPIVRKDCRLLCFDISSGRPIPRVDKTGDLDDDWQHARAAETIGYYHLDEGTWNARRFDIMASVQSICDDLIASKRDGNTSLYEESLDKLGDYVGYFSEFSSAAKQAIVEKLPDENLIAALY